MAAIAAVAGFSGAGHCGDEAGGGANFRDGRIEPVYEVYIAVGIDGERIYVVHGRFCSWASITGVACLPGSGHSGNHLSVSIDTPNCVGPSITDVQVSVDVERTPVGFPDGRLEGGASITGVAFFARTDDGLNLPNLEFHVLSQN